MAVISRHLAGSLRLTDPADETIHSYHRIRPTINASQVDAFLSGVSLLRGHINGNAFLTLSTELLED